MIMVTAITFFWSNMANPAISALVVIPLDLAAVHHGVVANEQLVGHAVEP